MSTWLNEVESLALGLAGAGITVATAFSLGKLAGEFQANAKFNEHNTTMLSRWYKENYEKTRLIEMMKRAGRRRREEVKALKKALKTKEKTIESGDDILLFVAHELAESGAEMLRKNTAMRDALHEIAGECAKSRWQMKVFRRILKKHGVKSNV